MVGPELEQNSHGRCARLRLTDAALALMTPIRRCRISKISLPRYFLEHFRLSPNPETGSFWWLPHSPILRSPKHNATSPTEISPVTLANSNNITSPVGSPSTNPAISSEHPLLEDGDAQQSYPGRPQVHDYLNARYAFIDAISTASAGYKSSLRALGSVIKLRGVSRALIDQALWRSDMADFMLSLIRSGIVDMLAHMSLESRNYLVGCESWEAARNEPDAGVILKLRQEAKDLGEMAEFGGQILDESEPSTVTTRLCEFATLETGNGGQNVLPVYDLQRLLGSQDLTKLTEIFARNKLINDVIVIRHMPATVELQQMLWHLEGYLARY